MPRDSNQTQRQQKERAAMERQESFDRFQQLPPEIRHHVWREALCKWAVWYTSHPHVNLQAHGLRIRMNPVGSAPYQAGLVCKESRYLMKGLYQKLLACGGSSASDSTPVYWLIPELTIVYLGCTSRATDFLEIFHAHQSLPLRHLVLHWSDLVDVTRFSHSLVCKCPDLQTFTLHAADRRTTPDMCRCDSPLSRHLADWYMTIAAWEAKELPYKEHPESEMLHWSVGEYFGDREEDVEGPRLHFLPYELQAPKPLQGDVGM
ncbi:hypothetical protein NLG97_g6614 [Lecanicillium saksenae]|uniref:Uncharacterized protein n=1 Tax=Lecanicillium saksenae TaxID=468837 RepID=A0ACC1QP97_9HYPO|nr:hypothetical protein NLG97_g6614 [Lecanicillium saksenae]